MWFLVRRSGCQRANQEQSARSTLFAQFVVYRYVRAENPLLNEEFKSRGDPRYSHLKEIFPEACPLGMRKLLINKLM